MNSDLYFEGKKFISSKRAAQISGYVTDYIGQLCRDGKLECRLVGRSWYVSFDSLISHKNANGNGTKSRSQKHVRKVALLELEHEDVGTLSAIGTDTSQVIYPEKVSAEESITTLKNNALVVVPNTDTQIKTPDDGTKIFIRKQTVALDVKKSPEEIAFESKLPSELWGSVPSPYVFYIDTKTFSQGRKFRNHNEFVLHMFPRAILGVLSLFIAIAGFWLAVKVNPQVEVAYNNVLQTAQDQSVEIFATASGAFDGEASVLTGAKDALDSAGIAVYRKVNGWIFKTQRRILVMAGKEPITETTIEIPVDNSKPTQGMVVVPTDKNTDRQAVVAKIKKSFSDEVSVEQSADGTNGVITPVFKKSKSDDYLYVLVPIKN